MRSVCLLLFVNLLMSGVYAQEQIARFEQEKKNNDEYFTVISGGKYGVVLIREDNSVRGREDKWVLTKLDTDLREEWTKDLMIESKFEFRAYEMFNEHLYVVFMEAERMVSNFLILDINLESGKAVPYGINNELAFELTNIIALQDRVVLSGYVRDSPTILSYEVGQKRFDVVPGYFVAKSDIIGLHRNMDNLTYNIVTMERAYTGYFLRLRTYSYDSDILFEREVQMRDNLQIIDGLTLGFVEGNIAIAGTYGSQSSNFIQGLYFAIIRPEGQDNLIRYHDFGEFEHFFDYTNPRRAERLEEKASELSERGKDLKLSLRLFLKYMIDQNGEYLLFAEVYDQEYSGGNTYYANPYGYLPYNRFYSLYDPYFNRYYRDPTRSFRTDQSPSYKFLESIVIGIDRNGNVRWDNSLVVDDDDAESMMNLVDAFASPEYVHMLYKFDKELVYKSIPYSSEPVEENIKEIMLDSGAEDIRNEFEDIGGVQFWYNNAFFVWGYQRIAGESGKRNVIFINKVIF